MNNCAVDSALGRHERFQAIHANQFDAEAEIVRPFVEAIEAMKSIVAALPISHTDKERWFDYFCHSMNEGDFGRENPDICLGEHIDGFAKVMGWE